MAIKVMVIRHHNKACENDKVTIDGKRGILTRCVNCDQLFIQEDINTALGKSSLCDCQIKIILLTKRQKIWKKAWQSDLPRLAL